MHSIHIHDVELHIPLSLSGVVSLFNMLAPTLANLKTLPCIVVTSSSPWNQNSPSFVAMEETYKVSSMNSRQGDANLIADLFRLYMISAVNTFDNAFHDTRTFRLSHDQDNLHHYLIAKVCIKLDPPTIPTDAKAEADPDAYYLEAMHTTSSLSTKSSKPGVTPEMLLSKWNIGLIKAKQTLKVMTQAGVRNVLVPSEQEVWKKVPWLKFPNLKGHWFSDAMFAKVLSIHGDNGTSMFTNGKGFYYVYGWKSKKQHPEALMSFIQIFKFLKQLSLMGGRNFTKEQLVKHVMNTPFSRNSQSHTAHGKMLSEKAFVRTKRVHNEKLDRLVCHDDFGHMLPNGLSISDA